MIITCTRHHIILYAGLLVKITGEAREWVECFDALDSLGKSSFILGSKLWEEHFDSLLHLVKDYIVNIWDLS